jgi:DtxR family Mn-dependent transcriptional regulator
VAYHVSVSQEPLTESIQHYLRAIYKLGLAGETASVTALARAQEVSPASASAMVKKLTALELAEHAPYGEITLTPAGERVALEVIRHHRLLELYLAEMLGVSVDLLKVEDDRVEHAFS